MQDYQGRYGVEVETGGTVEKKLSGCRVFLAFLRNAAVLRREPERLVHAQPWMGCRVDDEVQHQSSFRVGV